jgi:hypothetical protein
MLIVPAPGDYDDGEIGGMNGRGNRSTRRKPAPAPLCPSQTSHAARKRTRAAAVGSQRLTALAVLFSIQLLHVLQHLHSPITTFLLGTDRERNTLRSYILKLCSFIALRPRLTSICNYEHT